LEVLTNIGLRVLRKFYAYSHDNKMAANFDVNSCFLVSKYPNYCHNIFVKPFDIANMS